MREIIAEIGIKHDRYAIQLSLTNSSFCSSFGRLLAKHYNDTFEFVKIMYKKIADRAFGHRVSASRSRSCCCEPVYHVLALMDQQITL